MSEEGSYEAQKKNTTHSNTKSLLLRVSSINNIDRKIILQK